MLKLMKKVKVQTTEEVEEVTEQMEKQVTFSPTVEVAEIPRISCKLHYSKHEFKSIQNEVRSTIAYYHQLAKQVNDPTLIFQESSSFCLRGIEDHLDIDQRQLKKRTKLLAVLAVRCEQDRQWLENKAFTPTNVDIARCYERVCIKSQKEANQRGINDQNELQKQISSRPSLRISSREEGGVDATKQQLSSPKLGKIIHQRLLPRFVNPVSSAASRFLVSSRKTMTSKAA